MPLTPKSAALALATGALALSAPASAAPPAHSAAWDNHAPVYGQTVWDHGKKKKHKNKHRGSYQDTRYDYGRGYAAQPYYTQYSPYEGQAVNRNTQVWQGDDGRYYCRKDNGTTGLLIGAGVGALIGHQVIGRNGDRTLGAILGAAGGALLGRAIDKSSTRCR